MELDPFFYYFVSTKTLNLSNLKYKLVYLDQNSPIKNIKVSMGQQNLYFEIWEKYIVESLHIYGAGAILLLFCDHQYTESK